MGILVSDAVRMLPDRVAAGKPLPFEVRVPNATPVKAMRAADRRKDKRPRSAAASRERRAQLPKQSRVEAVAEGPEDADLRAVRVPWVDQNVPCRRDNHRGHAEQPGAAGL